MVEADCDSGACSIHGRSGCKCLAREFCSGDIFSCDFKCYQWNIASRRNKWRNGGSSRGAYGGYGQTGTISGTLKGEVSGGLAGAVSGAAFYGANSFNSIPGRVIVNATVGGTQSALSGGSFRDGFKVNFITSSARAGWESARTHTDRESLSGSGLHKYNGKGELLTDGTRETVYAPGFSRSENNWFTSSGMAPEGSGAHSYNENSWVGRFVNATSKVHDWMNHGGYEGGNYVSRSELYNTAFQAYSMVGMLPAAAFTAIALTPGPVTPYFDQNN